MTQPLSHWLSLVFLALVLFPAQGHRAEIAEDARASDSPSVFDLPSLQAAHSASLRVASRLLARGEFEQAERVLRQSIRRVPHDADCHYNLARLLARQGRAEEALTTLEEAVDVGFRDAGQMKADEALSGLRGIGRFEEIVNKAGQPLEGKPKGWHYEITPNEAVGGSVLVSEHNTAWDSKLGVLHSLFRVTTDQPIANGLGTTGRLLRSWYAERTAAGNYGDLYDNHDEGHSSMNLGALPQLTRIEFSEEARRRSLHRGLQASFLYNGVTIGNSSTALTGRYWRSQARNAMTRPRGGDLLYLQYVTNHLYVYPEHRDHDPQDTGGYGDIFPANTPYLIISQGSSGSDRAFLNAAGATLAAFRPEVKRKLAESGILMATLQMIFRRCGKAVRNPEDYLTGPAHPTVFDGEQIQTERMVRYAHAMRADWLPPMVQLKVIDEDKSIVGRDYFDVGPREVLFDTPCAIARIVKSSSYHRRMVVSAEASRDHTGYPLTFHWVVLRGDASRIQINRLNDAGSQVELIVPYHERRPITAGSTMQSNRVDIGVFVHNGRYFSAPGFVCFQYLANEKRVYDEQHRIRTIDYVSEELRDRYVDPLLDFQKNWRDEYHYAEEGSLLGWSRVRGGDRQEFTPEGQLVVEQAGSGKPAKTVPVRYIANPGNRSPKLEQVIEPVRVLTKSDASNTRS